MKKFLLNSRRFWTDFWTPSVDPRGLALARIFIFGGALLMVDSIFLNNSLNQTRFWQPISFFKIFSGPFLDVTTFNWLWRTCQICLFLSAIGLFFRLTAPVSALIFLILSGYNYNFGKVHHSYQVLALSLLILAFSPANSRYSIDKFLGLTRPKAYWKYGFPLRLIMLHVAYVMTLNGFLKLWHSGLPWVFSDNLALHLFHLPVIPDITLTLLKTAPYVFSILAGITILIECLSFLAFWNLYSAFFFFVLWSLFHVGVHFIMGGHTTFFTQILSYSVFPLFFIFKRKTDPETFKS